MGLCTVYVIDWATEDVVRIFHLCAHTADEAMAKAKTRLEADPLPPSETPYDLHFHVQLIVQLAPPGRVIVAARMQ